MLETTDFDAMHNVVFSLNAIFDSMCDLCHTAEMTKALTEYVNLASFIFRRHFKVEWKKETLQYLRS